MHPNTTQTVTRLQAAERTIDYALTQTVLPLDSHLALASAQWHLRRDLAQLELATQATAERAS